MVIYNNTTGTLNGTLSDTFTLDIPVTSVTQDVGQQLAATAGLVMRVKTDTFRGTATTSNILAETPGGDPDNVVMAGAHLDSVNAGPGINDNGSGSAALLEIAEQMAKVKPVNKVRFALWGAEESGLVGSNYYVANLPADELQKIALYLNFDMIASPNYVRFVYDGDDSDGVGAGPGPEGSAQIEAAFNDYFAGQGLAFKGTDFSGRSDYQAFILNGIPAGGLFTGAEGIKSRGGSRTLRWHRRRRLRPVLPPGLRHDRQRQQPGARGDGRCRRAHHPHLRVRHPYRQRRREGPPGEPPRTGGQRRPGDLQLDGQRPARPGARTGRSLSPSRDRPGTAQ